MFKTIEREVNFIIDITSTWPPKGSIRIPYIYIYVSILCRKSRSVNWVHSSVVSDFKNTVKSLVKHGNTTIHARDTIAGNIWWMFQRSLRFFLRFVRRIIVRHSFDSILLIYKDFFRANLSEHHFSMVLGKQQKKRWVKDGERYARDMRFRVSLPRSHHWFKMECSSLGAMY